MSKIKLDNYIKICLTIISGSILFVLFSIGTLFLYVFFFYITETTQDERYQQHIEQHILEAEKLDSIIHVLEEINKNLDD